MENKKLKRAILAKCEERKGLKDLPEINPIGTGPNAVGYIIDDLDGICKVMFHYDADHPVWPLAAMLLGIDRGKPEPVPFFESQLHELCVALGWQGGTYHQVLQEIKRLKSADGKPKEARPQLDFDVFGLIEAGEAIRKEAGSEL